MRLFVIVLSKEDKIKREREIVRKMRSKEWTIPTSITTREADTMKLRIYDSTVKIIGWKVKNEETWRVRMVVVGKKQYSVGH
jgi:hypothetical protein